MCGISGVVRAGEGGVAQQLFRSIRNLEYRGYDSCGVCTLHGDARREAREGLGEAAFEVRKNVGGVDEVEAREHLTLAAGSMGIAHTRWATHGAVTKRNAHPHLSFDGRFALVHNGIITNHRLLRAELGRRGIACVSETDSELVAHLLALAYEESDSVSEALLQTLERLEGCYALAVMSTKAPGQLFGVRQGSPLVVGLAPQTAATEGMDAPQGTFSSQGTFPSQGTLPSQGTFPSPGGEQYIASDVNAFLEYTRQALPLQDGELVTLSADGMQLVTIASLRPVEREPLHIPWTAETARKRGYPHFMLKEIFEQPETLTQVVNLASEELEQLAARHRRVRAVGGRVYYVGVGSTYHAALCGQYMLRSEARFPLQAVSSDEFPSLIEPCPADLVLAISQSGETYDTRRALAAAREAGAQTVSVVNAVGSSLTVGVDQVLMQGSGPEISVVSTKAVLAQVGILLRLALLLGGPRETVTAALGELPQVLHRALNECSGFVSNLAEKHAQAANWFFLGRGVYHPLALEAALKLKEVAYCHAEGMPAGFLKHGALALIDEAMRSFFFLPHPAQRELHQLTLNSIEEVRCRGGITLGIRMAGDEEAAQALDAYITAPPVEATLWPLLQMILAQLFTYHVARKLGRPIDKPRNLAKSVTVG